jgi:hypothetical protein
VLEDARTIRISAEGGISGDRLFGKILLFGAPSIAPPGPAEAQKLRFWDPVVDVQAPPGALEFGDVTKDAVYTKQIRVKNLSTVLTAKTIEITATSVYTPSPPTSAFFDFSFNEIAWSNPFALGDLAPGAVSAIVYVRQTIPSTALLGLWWLRLSALPDSWEA